MKIEILNPVWAKADEPSTIQPFVKLQKEFWRKGAFASRTKKAYEVSLVDKNGEFLLGFLDRICRELSTRNIAFEVIGRPEKLTFEIQKIAGYTLRPDQEHLVSLALSAQRGVIKAPTGSGKTVIMGHIAKSLPGKKLFLCHSVSLVTQTYEEFQKMSLNPSLLYGKEKNLDGDVVISTIQAISRVDKALICDMFDVVLVDEAHRIGGFEGTYAQVLKVLIADIRIGLTATLPKRGVEASLALEGLIGPVIGSLSMKKAIASEIIAVPKVKLIGIPKNSNIQMMKRYHEIYQTGIVKNRMRNKAIAKFASEMKAQGKTLLIYVNQLEHIDMIATELEKLSVFYDVVKGEIESEDREQIKKLIGSKKIDVVIASSAWKEGINIPSIDCVVIAGGGKSEIAVLQSAGRGLRRTAEKTEVLIVDFIDQGKYLSEHMAERLNTYYSNGWL